MAKNINITISNNTRRNYNVVIASRSFLADGRLLESFCGEAKVEAGGVVLSHKHFIPAESHKCDVSLAIDFGQDNLVARVIRDGKDGMITHTFHWDREEIAVTEEPFRFKVGEQEYLATSEISPEAGNNLTELAVKLTTA